MSDTARTQAFADALKQLEQGSPDQLLGMFADGAELLRPESEHAPQASGPEEFWEQYSSQFTDISTEFTRTVEEGDEGVLEWHSEGTLATGRPISYAGVSLLTFDGERVSRFATYYDTAAFVLEAD